MHNQYIWCNIYNFSHKIVYEPIPSLVLQFRAIVYSKLCTLHNFVKKLQSQHKTFSRLRNSCHFIICILVHFQANLKIWRKINIAFFFAFEVSSHLKKRKKERLEIPWLLDFTPVAHKTVVEYWYSPRRGVIDGQLGVVIVLREL